MAAAIALVEPENFSNSKTPEGPFHTIVRHRPDRRAVELDRLRAGVEAHPAGGDSLLAGYDPGVGVRDQTYRRK
jgi:hypothetical protein